MKPPLSAIALLCLSFGAIADESERDEPKKKAIEQALERFSGTWEIITVQPPGSTKEARKLLFRKDQTYAALDKNGKELWAGTFNLDATTKPNIWDHRSYESQKNGGDALGIYDLDGDKLKVCGVVGIWKGKEWTGKPRSTEFKLPSADFVLELRRLKSVK